MAKLSVNVNKVATLRNTRNAGVPSVVRAAAISLDAGAAGITVHPRPDQRHIRPADVRELAVLLRRYPQAEFNIEGNPFHAYMDLIREVRPAQCTLVPDEPAAVTSNHGWTLDEATCDRLRPMVEEMVSLGCRVSVFVDPEPAAIRQVKRLPVQRVELYTEPFAAGFASTAIVAQYVAAAETARALELGVNAGHDLNLVNLPLLVAAIPFLAEVSIGHALIADALEMGLTEAVRRYIDASGSLVPSPGMRRKGYPLSDGEGTGGAATSAR